MRACRDRVDRARPAPRPSFTSSERLQACARAREDPFELDPRPHPRHRSRSKGWGPSALRRDRWVLHLSRQRPTVPDRLCRAEVRPAPFSPCGWIAGGMRAGGMRRCSTARRTGRVRRAGRRSYTRACRAEGIGGRAASGARLAPYAQRGSSPPGDRRNQASGAWRVVPIADRLEFPRRSILGAVCRGRPDDRQRAPAAEAAAGRLRPCSGDRRHS